MFSKSETFRHSTYHCAKPEPRNWQRLDDLIIRIGRMIAYQEYNTKSPLNGLAAKWAVQNSHLLPIDLRPVAPPSRGGEPTEVTEGEVESPLPQMGIEEHPAVEDPWSGKIVIESQS